MFSGKDFGKFVHSARLPTWQETKKGLAKLDKFRREHGQQAIQAGNILHDLSERDLFSAGLRAWNFPGSNYPYQYRKKPLYYTGYIKPSRAYFQVKRHRKRAFQGLYKNKRYKRRTKKWIPYHQWIKKQRRGNNSYKRKYRKGSTRYSKHSFY